MGPHVEGVCPGGCVCDDLTSVVLESVSLLCCYFALVSNLYLLIVWFAVEPIRSNVVMCEVIFIKR